MELCAHSLLQKLHEPTGPSRITSVEMLFLLLGLPECSDLLIPEDGALDLFFSFKHHLAPAILAARFGNLLFITCPPS